MVQIQESHMYKNSLVLNICHTEEQSSTESVTELIDEYLSAAPESWQQLCSRTDTDPEKTWQSFLNGWKEMLRWVSGRWKLRRVCGR